MTKGAQLALVVGDEDAGVGEVWGLAALVLGLLDLALQLDDHALAIDLVTASLQREHLGRRVAAGPLHEGDGAGGGVADGEDGGGGDVLGFDAKLVEARPQRLHAATPDHVWVMAAQERLHLGRGVEVVDAVAVEIAPEDGRPGARQQREPRQGRHLQETLGARDVSAPSDVGFDDDALAHSTGRQVHQLNPRRRLRRRQRHNPEGLGGAIESE